MGVFWCSVLRPGVHVLSANNINISTENIEVQTMIYRSTHLLPAAVENITSSLHHHTNTVQSYIIVKGAHTMHRVLSQKQTVIPRNHPHHDRCIHTQLSYKSVSMHYSLIAHLSNTYKAQIKGGPWECWRCLLVMLTKRCVSVVNV